MTATTKDRRSDLQADLLVDLTLSEPLAAPAVVEPVPVPVPAGPGTPVVSLHWTPLRWSRPRVVRAAGGPGKALKVGPVQLELTVRQ